jgi:hypothetical protein
MEKVAQGSPATLLPFGSPITVNQPVNELLWSGKVHNRWYASPAIDTGFIDKANLQVTGIDERHDRSRCGDGSN